MSRREGGWKRNGLKAADNKVSRIWSDSVRLSLIRSDSAPVGKDESGTWFGRRASRGAFARQSVNVVGLEALTKVRPVNLPVRNRQRHVRFQSNHPEMSIRGRSDSASKPKFTSTRPKFTRFKNSNRGDDAGNQFRRGHVEAGVERRTSRVGHAKVTSLPVL